MERLKKVIKESTKLKEQLAVDAKLDDVLDIVGVLEIYYTIKNRRQLEKDIKSLISKWLNLGYLEN